MLRVALTGGIASGKSTAADAFRQLGVPVIDADRIARDVVAPGEPGLDALIGAFGDAILDDSGRLDRAELRQRIFSTSATRERVDALLHPLILQRIREELAGLHAPYVIVEVPLLAESGMHRDFDRVLVVDVPEAVQIRRLQQRDGTTASEARQALNAQATREQRLALADDVIENTGSRDELASAIEALHARYLSLAERFASAGGRPSE